jgi:hypothetical protein
MVQKNVTFAPADKWSAPINGARPHLFSTLGQSLNPRVYFIVCSVFHFALYLKLITFYNEKVFNDITFIE